MIGVVGAKDLPAEPSEEEFRLGLRSGIILCNVINKVQPGAVPKVVYTSVLIILKFVFLLIFHFRITYVCLLINLCIYVALQVVESSASIPDGAYTAFQYFENLRNFCVAIEEMGLPTFEASDLEQVCART